MTNHDDATNRRPETPRPRRVGRGGRDARVAAALKALALLDDGSARFAPGPVIARARGLAETYARWRRSGALIKDIIIRLSDGQEMALGRTKSGGLCGVRLRDSFPPNAVLHVWKKADEYFGEVLLLSLALQDVPAAGYDCTKSYENGQTLSLKVKRCPDAQFHIDVDCAPAESAASRRAVGAVRPSARARVTAAVTASGSFLHHPQRRLGWRPSLPQGAAAVAGLTLATLGLLSAPPAPPAATEATQAPPSITMTLLPPSAAHVQHDPAACSAGGVASAEDGQTQNRVSRAKTKAGSAKPRTERATAAAAARDLAPGTPSYAPPAPAGNTRLEGASGAPEGTPGGYTRPGRPETPPAGSEPSGERAHVAPQTYGASLSPSPCIQPPEPTRLGVLDEQDTGVFQCQP